MECKKRKEVEASHDGSQTGKRLKLDDNDLSSQTLQSKANKLQGPDDESIGVLFDALRYSITNFALTHFKGAPYANPRKAQQKEIFESLTSSDCKVYLTSRHPGAKRRIIQAVVWNQLVDRLLSTPTRAFLDMPEGAIKDWALDAPGEFYAWRAMTAHFLSNNSKEPTAWGEDGLQRHEFIDETAELLLDHAVERDVDKIKQDLDGISEKAVELATAMACCRAGWVCTMKDPRKKALHGFKIKTDRMEDVELWDEGETSSKSLVVDLVAVPMLLKYGNSSGQDYATGRVSKKAQVVTKPQKGQY